MQPEPFEFTTAEPGAHAAAHLLTAIPAHQATTEADCDLIQPDMWRRKERCQARYRIDQILSRVRPWHGEWQL